MPKEKRQQDKKTNNDKHVQNTIEKTKNWATWIVWKLSKIYIGILQWNIVESDVKHHNPTLSCFAFQKFLFSLKPTSKWKPVVKCYQLEYNNESDQLEGTYLEKMKLNDVEIS